jgi:UDP-N-acetylglucosamine 1-carboxyvinyltransferase
VTDMVTVTGTENLMMAAVLAEGETIIENAAREPEVVDLANCLVSMGAQISGAGTDRIRIRASSACMAHRMRSWPIASRPAPILCAPRRPVAIRLTEYLGRQSRRGGRQVARRRLRLLIERAAITLKAPRRLKAVSIRTSPYPAFPTDMQAQFMAINCVAEGSAVIRETIFENRFMHAVELIRLGADIKIDASNAMVTGVERLEGATVMATDLRASASLVIAGLVAQGETLIERIYHLDRGYERIEEKLGQLGAQVRRLR